MFELLNPTFLIYFATVAGATGIILRYLSKRLVEDGKLRLNGEWVVFKLGDGATIKVKVLMKGAKRLNRFVDGKPVYTVETESIVQVVELPETKEGARA